MARKKYKTDTEILHEALTAVEDPYNIRPLLADAPLNGEINERLRYAAEVFRPQINKAYGRTIGDFVAAGRYLKAAEELIERGNSDSNNSAYAEFVDGSGWSEEFVRCSIRFVEVVACFPEAIHLPPGRGLSKILHWSAERIKQFLQDDIGQDNLPNLTPQKLLDVYREKQEEARQKKKEKAARLSAQRARRLREKLAAEGKELRPPTAFEGAIASYYARLESFCLAAEALESTLYSLTDSDREFIGKDGARAKVTEPVRVWLKKLSEHPGWPPPPTEPFQGLKGQRF